MNAPQLGSGESKLETAISWLLIVGVVISMVLEIAGIAMYYHTYRQVSVSQDPSVFIQSNNFFTFIYDQFRHAQGSGAARMMTAGIIILILTPYLRVVVSALYFAREKNFKYVVITLFVLIVLTVTLIKH
jgi:uncharacterized membrane protein